MIGVHRLIHVMMTLGSMSRIQYVEIAMGFTRCITHSRIAPLAVAQENNRSQTCCVLSSL